MATVLTNTPAAQAKADAVLERELGKAADRIRTHDLLTGTLALAVLTLGYAAAVVVLDKTFDLPAWSRQLGFAGFVLAFLGLAAVVLVRPLRRSINPRYAAKQVEGTIEDAKNAVINWVDLRERDLPDAVRASVAVRAAEGVAAADVQRVAESRRLVWLGAAAGLLVALLAVLFILFKPAPFVSLLGRAFTPFTAGKIASRTELELTAPAGGDVTVTDGEPLTVAVYVRGSVPDPDGPARVRLLVRHNPAATDYDAIPLEQAGGAREWSLRLPQSVIQNGFWYKVAAGDARTEEYRVTVRSKPLLREFEVRYDYPAYTRLQPETDRLPQITAYRGTTVTVTAKANREVKRGWVQFPGRPEPIAAEVVGEGKDSIRFQAKLTESGTYQLGFTSSADEPSQPAGYPVAVVIDQAPTVTLTAPSADAVDIPANGLLKVDGTVGDDMGIASAELVMKYAGREYRKKYRDGASLRSETDQSYPTSLDYKDSISLTELKDAAKNPVVLQPGTDIEFWVEATDNCTEPKPNIGKSVTRRLKVIAPDVQPEKVKQLEAERVQRKADEAEHRAKQDEQLRKEKREMKPLHPDANKQDQPPPAPEATAPQEDVKPPEQPKAAAAPPQSGGEPIKPQAQPDQSPMPRPAGTEPPKGMPPEAAATPPEAGGTPAPNDKGKKPEGTPQGTAAPKPQDQAVDKTAEQIGQEIEKQQRQPGEARPQDPVAAKEPAPPAESKPGGQQPESKAAQPADAGGDTQKNPPVGGDPGQERKGPPQPGAEPKKQPEPGKPAGAGEPSPKSEEQRAGDGKGDKPVDPAERKKPAPGPARPEEPSRGAKPDPAAPKPTPSDDPMKPEESASANKGAGGKPKAGAGGQPMPPGGANQDNEVPKGEEKRELARELGDKNSKGSAMTDADREVERLFRESENLNSPDPKARQQAEQKFDQQFGREKRQDLQDKLATGDPKKKEEARKDIDELAKKKKPQPPKDDRTANREPSKEEMQRAAEAMKDLNSTDPDKKAAAEQQMDRAVGKENREKIQQGLKDSQSPDPAKRAAAEQQLQDAAKDIARKSGQPQPSKEEIEKLRQQAKDLNSDDPAKRAAAEKDFDKALGKNAREQLQQEMKNAASEQEKQDAAGRKLDQVAQQKPGDAGRQPSKEEIEKLAEKAKDLNSTDPEKRKAAEEEFDKALGKNAREQLQKEMKARAATETAKEQEAKDKLAKAADEKAKQDGAKPPTADEMKQLAEQAKDLNSTDPAKKAAAEKALDDKIGKAAREQAQKDLKDLQSDDPATREAAKERMRKAIEEAAKQPRDNPPSPEDVEKWKKAAEDLKSADPKTREAAEQAFDKEVGKEAREQLQKQMQDPNADDPAKAEAARKLAEQAARNRNTKEWRPGGAGGGMEEKLFDGDPKNRLKTAELRLQDFEKNKYNKELHDKLGYTREQYEQFLKAYEERVARLRDEVEKPAVKENTPLPAGAASLKVGEGSGGKKTELRGDGTKAAGSSAAGTAPPGYSDAQKRFAEEAAKLKRGEPVKK